MFISNPIFQNIAFYPELKNSWVFLNAPKSTSLVPIWLNHSVFTGVSGVLRGNLLLLDNTKERELINFLVNNDFNLALSFWFSPTYKAQFAEPARLDITSVDEISIIPATEQNIARVRKGDMYRVISADKIIKI